MVIGTIISRINADPSILNTSKNLYYQKLLRHDRSLLISLISVVQFTIIQNNDSNPFSSQDTQTFRTTEFMAGPDVRACAFVMKLESLHGYMVGPQGRGRG